MTGRERAMFYRLAVETGLRRDELHSLKKSSFDFDNYTITVEAGYTKNKKKAVFPLRKTTAVELQEFLAGKMPDAKAFKVPEKTADMIKEDLAASRFLMLMMPEDMLISTV
jgi:integrase